MLEIVMALVKRADAVIAAIRPPQRAALARQVIRDEGTKLDFV